MTWQDFYLVTFLVGFLLSAISFVMGMIHLPHAHFPGHHSLGNHGHSLGRVGMKGGGHVSPFNFGSAAAFLAWFGGTGYLMQRYSSFWIYVILGVALISGLGGAAVVFWFLAKLHQHEQPLNQADYDMIGVLGRVASPIRPGGTGEIIYSRAGSRRASPARCEEGSEITRDAEVIVTRFEKGVAYVRRWEDFS